MTTTTMRTIELRAKRPGFPVDLGRSIFLLSVLGEPGVGPSGLRAARGRSVTWLTSR
jgi:hypothetical protein